MNLISSASRPIEQLLRSRLVAGLTAPHGVDRYLDWLAPLRVEDEMRSRLLERRQETPDCVTLSFATPRGWRGHQAGQHVTLGVEIDGVRRSRCFSIASSNQRVDSRIEITVKAQADGQVSRFLVDQAKPGLTVTLSPASGEFTLPAQLPEGLLLISGGSGITPVMSMLRSLLDQRYTGQIVFLHYSRSYSEQIFAAELKALEDAHGNLRVIHVLTGQAPRAGDLAGRFNAGHLLHADPAGNNWPAYACGPAPLIEALQTHWQQAGASDRLRFEYFKPPQSRGTAGQAEVRFVRGQLAVSNDGRSLLEQAEAAGLRPEYGCRMGICRSCTCRKTQGRVRNLLTGQLSGDEAEDIQPCITTPAGDVSLEL